MVKRLDSATNAGIGRDLPEPLVDPASGAKFRRKKGCCGSILDPQHPHTSQPVPRANQTLVAGEVHIAGEASLGRIGSTGSRAWRLRSTTEESCQEIHRIGDIDLFIIITIARIIAADRSAEE